MRSLRCRGWRRTPRGPVRTRPGQGGGVRRLGRVGKFIPIRLAMEVHALAQTEHVFVNGCFDKDLREEKLGYKTKT